jgi:short-subunit dehydrogenase
MRRHGRGGHIVNTASTAGLQVNPSHFTGAYSMTKYAVVALSEALENELKGSGIKVSVVAPSAVRTSIARSAKARPDRLGGLFQRSEYQVLDEALQAGLSPEDVAGRILQAMEEGEFFIFTSSREKAAFEIRHKRILDGFECAARWERFAGSAPQG